MTDMLKQSAARRQQKTSNNNNNRNLPLMVEDEADDFKQDNSNIDRMLSVVDDSPNANANNNDRGNNIGNIPGSSRGVTNCMNKSWKICSLFGIEIHIHVLLPLFFIATFLVWMQLILKDTSNAVWYILLIVLFNVSLWECILIHELGHCLAGYMVGGHTDKVLLWPLGGLAFTQLSPYTLYMYHTYSNYT